MAWDSYRRLIRDFAVKLHGAAEEFLLQEEALLTKKGKKSLAELGVEDMKLLVQQYKTLYNLNVMSPFPQELSGQLLEVIRYFYEKRREGTGKPAALKRSSGRERWRFCYRRWSSEAGR